MTVTFIHVDENCKLCARNRHHQSYVSKLLQLFFVRQYYTGTGAKSIIIENAFWILQSAEEATWWTEVIWVKRYTISFRWNIKKILLYFTKVNGQGSTWDFTRKCRTFFCKTDMNAAQKPVISFSTSIHIGATSNHIETHRIFYHIRVTCFNKNLRGK